jgi:hypothetical protein
MRRLTIALAVALAAALAACGGGDDGGDGGADGGDRPAAAETRSRLNGADDPQLGLFPATRGRSLQAVADAIGATGTQIGLATSVFTPRDSRLAFGVLDEQNRFVYGQTAVYVAQDPGAPARGPFPAPADLLVTEPAFRSRQAASEDDPFAAIYEAQLRLDQPGDWAILVVTQIDGRLVAAPAQIRVSRRTAIPEVGDRAPAVDTDTVASAGSIEAIETRTPPDDMHDVNLRDVLGRKPVALVFATPQFCQTRVCGPVVDIALQLKEQYGDEVAFIHQEVYVDNDPAKGLREPLRRFGLRTEPWLFTIDRSGRVVARLEGSFGLRGTERAIRAALGRR